MIYFENKPFAGVLTTVSSSELSSSELDSWVFFTADGAVAFLTAGVSSSSELSSSELDSFFPFLAATTENDQILIYIFNTTFYNNFRNNIIGYNMLA